MAPDDAANRGRLAAVKGYGAESFGERMAEVYDDWYGTRLAAEKTLESVEVLADLAAGGRVLELAIDLMARLAGFTLRDRWGGWDRSPFTASSSSHVSVYGHASR